MIQISESDIKQQEKNRLLVNREVGSNITSLMDYALKKSPEDPKSPYSLENVLDSIPLNKDNLIYDIVSDSDLKKQAGKYLGIETEIGSEAGLEARLKSKSNYDLKDITLYLKIDPEYYQSQIHEWWTVSSWLAGQLKKRKRACA